jgi:hypothetical protein
MLQPVIELKRLVSVSREPHAVATDGSTVWISSRVTRRVDVMNAESWQKTGEIDPPSMAWGMAYGRGEVAMTFGDGPEDNRKIRRYRDGGFIGKVIVCPDDTGSHLSFVGEKLIVGQWYYKKLHLVKDDGTVERTYDTPHEVAGVAVVDGAAHVIGTDEEVDGKYYITRVDLRSGSSKDIALVPFRARGLASDGTRFWTNHREADRTVIFSLPNVRP